MNVGLNWKELDRPLKWERLFGNNNPIDCEIGFGNGEFLIKKAKAHPERNFLGIDYSEESFRKAKKAIEKEGISSVKLICLEAKAAFVVLIPEKSFSHIYVNFPDPWPKKRHLKNRLLDREFLTIAAACSDDKGKLIIATDDPFYRDFILEEIASTYLWNSLFKKGWTNELSGHFSTKYERKWKKEGKEIFYMIFQKKVHPKKKFRMKEYKIPKEISLPHQNISKLLEGLLEEAICKKDSVAKLLKYEEKEDKFLLNIFLKDDTLIRKESIIIGKNKDKWILKMPENLFCTLSLKLFIDKMKALTK
ncbi:MAG: tRNA (guanosine(46)-N7)-methyltransferase TrmB [candidate division WOR-3 bacterium]